MKTSRDSLPIDPVLPDITAALGRNPNLIITAPPGTGKTTRVPLALAGESWCDGSIILLEPRRLAAKTAAERMASTLGEKAGETVGYRVRFESRTSKKTRIEAVTEGVLLRRLLADPSLEGVSALIFDEAHERSLDCDLALALAIEAQGAFRPDLRIIVMSATLDAAVFEKALQAETIEATAPMFPVKVRYQPYAGGREKLVKAMTEAVRAALPAETGSLLCFLPGEGEIRSVAAALEADAPPRTLICPLYGRLDRREQETAIRPAPEGTRKVVLATSIAQTSLTIEGVRVVIDSGFDRKPERDPGTGMTRLVTRRASRATIEQRRGRAGRLEPGTAIRLWSKDAEGAFPDHDEPEILNADLAGPLLSLAAWGARVEDLLLPDPPPPAALESARDLLLMLGLFDEDGRLTGAGEDAVRLPLHPRPGAMICSAPEKMRGTAAELAAFLSEPGFSGRTDDVEEAFRRFRQSGAPQAKAARTAARRWASNVSGTPDSEASTIGELLSLAYPDRIARNRDGKGRFHLSGGQGAVLDQDHRLAREEFLVVPDLSVRPGRPGDAEIRLAVPFSGNGIRTLFSDRLKTETVLGYDEKNDAVVSDDITRLFALRIKSVRNAAPPEDAVAGVLLGVIRQKGFQRLGAMPKFDALRRRIAFGSEICGIKDLPDMSEKALLDTADAWLLPHLFGQRRIGSVTDALFEKALISSIPWDLARKLDELCPPSYQTPSGLHRTIDYDPHIPCAIVQCRPQHIYGLSSHPSVAGGKIPLTFELLSPADRPVQKTSDIPAFWKGGWTDLKKDMKGRYPKHDWPDNPENAVPRTKTGKN